MSGKTSEKVPIGGLEFVKLIPNHLEFRKKLTTLGLKDAELQTAQFAQHIGLCWLHLGRAHLKDAIQASKTKNIRAGYSRAYYAAYNISKAVRYIVTGAVSMKGDDHGKAGAELPGDFPDVPKWAQVITRLYEQRLRADYDNWGGKSAKFTVSLEEAVSDAKAFDVASKKYLTEKFGIKL